MELATPTKMPTETFVVRTGEGVFTKFKRDPDNLGNQFTDSIEVLTRAVKSHRGNWRSVAYKGKRYPLLGDAQAGWFICLNSTAQKPNKHTASAKEMRQGTLYFCTKNHAWAYYRRRGLEADLNRKINSGEVAIGKPKGRVFLDQDGRYNVKSK